MGARQRGPQHVHKADKAKEEPKAAVRKKKKKTGIFKKKEADDGESS